MKWSLFRPPERKNLRRAQHDHQKLFRTFFEVIARLRRERPGRMWGEGGAWK